MTAIPLNNGEQYEPTSEQLEEFKTAFPALDIEQEVRKMRAWTLANPSNAKTRRGVLKFMNSWLSKAQNRAPAKGGGEDTPESAIKGSMQALGHNLSDDGLKLWMDLIGSHMPEDIRKAFKDFAMASQQRPHPMEIRSRLQKPLEAPRINPPVNLYRSTAGILARRIAAQKGWDDAENALEASYPGQGRKFVMELRNRGVLPLPVPSNPTDNGMFRVPMREPGCDDDL